MADIRFDKGLDMWYKVWIWGFGPEKITTGLLKMLYTPLSSTSLHFMLSNNLVSKIYLWINLWITVHLGVLQLMNANTYSNNTNLVCYKGILYKKSDNSNGRQRSIYGAYYLFQMCSNHLYPCG